MELGKNLTIIKAENGNVLIQNSAADILASIPIGTPIELKDTLLEFRLGPTIVGGIISFGASQVDNTQTEPSAAIPFAGTIQDLFVIMQDFVAAPASGGGGGDASGAKQDEQTEELRDVNSNLAEVLANQVSGRQVVTDYSDAVERGMIDGVSVVLKAGYNPNIGVTVEPNHQLIGGGGGLYTGFITSDGNIQVVSSSASDIGTLSITYLASPTSTDYQTTTISVNGTTPVNPGIKAFRIHTANYIPSTPSVNPQNLGTITVRLQSTPANVFLVVLPYRNQSNTAIYTVPKGKKATIKNIRYSTGNSTGSTGAYVHTAIATKSTTEAFFRFRRPQIIAYGVQVIDDAGLVLGENTDIALYVTEANTANTKISASFSVFLEPQ